MSFFLFSPRAMVSGGSIAVARVYGRRFGIIFGINCQHRFGVWRLFRLGVAAGPSSPIACASLPGEIRHELFSRF